MALSVNPISFRRRISLCLFMLIGLRAMIFLLKKFGEIVSWQKNQQISSGIVLESGTHNGNLGGPLSGNSALNMLILQHAIK